MTIKDTASGATTETVDATTTDKQVVNDGITRVIDATGIDLQKSRYKAMRAIAWQAFTEAIESGDFEALVDRAIANVDSLPSGWEVDARATTSPKVATKAEHVAPKEEHQAEVAARDVVHEANPNAVNGCMCGQRFGNKGALTRHLRRQIVPLIKAEAVSA